MQPSGYCTHQHENQNDNQNPSEHNRSFRGTLSMHSYGYTDADIRFHKPLSCPKHPSLVVVVRRTRATAPVGSPRQKPLVVCQAASWKTARGWWRMSSMHDRYIGGQSTCQFGSAQGLGQNCSICLRGRIRGGAGGVQRRFDLELILRRSSKVLSL